MFRHYRQTLNNAYTVYMVFLIILGVITLVAVIFFAVSKKSSFIMRIAAVGALALMVVTVIVCLIIIFSTSTAPQVLILPDMSDYDEPSESGNSIILMLVAILVFIAMFATVLLISMKEHKKSKEPPSYQRPRFTDY